jgi:hypothetical protein
MPINEQQLFSTLGRLEALAGQAVEDRKTQGEKLDRLHDVIQPLVALPARVEQLETDMGDVKKRENRRVGIAIGAGLGGSAGGIGLVEFFQKLFTK